MKPGREDLDDIIDRVAAAMTYVPADRTVVDSINQRLHQRAHSSGAWWYVIAAAGVAVILVAALIVMREEPSNQQPLVATRTSPVPATAPTAPTRGAREELPRTLSTTATRVARTRAPGPSALPRELPELDPLAKPEVLAVEALTTSPLTITSVALDPLDVASLEDRGAAEPDQPKE